MICSHGRPEFRKNAQADTKSPDFLMILIIRMQSGVRILPTSGQ